MNFASRGRAAVPGSSKATFFTDECRDSTERRVDFLGAARGDFTGHPELRVSDPIE